MDNFTQITNTTSRTLLFVGFSGGLEKKILGFPAHNQEIEYQTINNSFLAVSWLEETLAVSDEVPFGIIIHASYLDKEGVHLLDFLRKSPDFRAVPLICLDKLNDEAFMSQLFTKGMDDCYPTPILWSELEARLEFLNKYKPQLLKRAAQNFQEDSFQYRIPPMKRVIDVVGASAIILGTSPIWIPTAIAIMVESGYPIIYRSKRAGTGYQVFDFLKFRSMWKDADQRLAEFAANNQYGGSDSGSVFIKLKNDPRVTKVGKFIRKYSIDELPQLINIIKGDMSLVGNRPLPLYEAEKLTRDDWAGRFLAPAGLTGLWQVTKRGSDDMSMEERMALDLEYAENWTVWKDIQILFKTLTSFIQKEDV